MSSGYLCVPEFDCLIQFNQLGWDSMEERLDWRTWSQEPVIKILSSPDPDILSQNARVVKGPVWPL